MLVITQFCYIQSERTNCPVREICFPGFDSIKESVVIEALNEHWASHAPFERYSGFGKDNVWIGSLNHTFFAKLKAD